VELVLVSALFFATRRSGKDRLRAEESAERLRVTLASIGDGIIVTDEVGRITRLNEVAQALTGWNEGEAVGRPAEQVFIIANEESGEPAGNPIYRVLREGIASGLANHTVLISRDGRRVPIDDSVAPIKTTDGHMTGVVMVFRDITERRRAEHERTELLKNELDAKAEAERANRLKDEFLAVLSHELRTPLSSILGWAHVLNSRDVSEERGQYAIQAIVRGAQAEAQLVNSLLDLSRIISGKLHLEMKALDLVSIVNAAADTVRPAAETKHISIDVVVPESPVVMTGDAGRLEQIIWNLLSNAVKFTPEQGRVEVRLKQTDSHAVIEVHDNGKGIRPDFLPHVFDRFAQAEGGGRDAHVGLGLGLAIVRELVQGHGGTIRAASAGEGQGSTFTVNLPLSSAAASIETAAENR
jgi:PAS domain S-box-containing protein